MVTPPASQLLVSDDARLDQADKLFLLSPAASYDAVSTVFCGHSNTVAISVAMIGPVPRATSMAYWDARRYGLATLRGGQVDEAYLQTMAELAATKHLAIVWLGNQVATDFLLTPGRPLDLIVPGRPDLRLVEGAQIVPVSAIQAHFRPHLQPLEAFVAACPKARQHFLIGTHPPMEDEAEIRRRLSSEPHFLARAAAIGIDLASIPITPATVRLKLWHVLTDMMADLAARHGLVFVPAPRAGTTEGGYLRPDCAQDDVTHTNMRYGQLVLENFMPYLQAAGIQPTGPA